MESIETIIENINKLDNDFNILNSRIKEYANSTKNKSLDYELLTFYIESLEKYKDLANKYKKELKEKDFSKAEYKVKKEIFIFRLEKLEKIFNVNINKLKLILKTQEQLNANKKNKIHFTSSFEMVEINKSIYEFYREYEKNLWFQKKYNVNISLNDDFEDKIEKELNSKELIKKEKAYLKGLNKLFEDIEIIIYDINSVIKKLRKLKNIYNLYEKTDFIYNIFSKNIKKEYANKNFNITNSEIHNDFLKIKEKLTSEKNIIYLILSILDFKKKYNKFLSLDSTFQIFGNKYFNDILDLYYKFSNVNSKNQLKQYFKDFGGIRYITKKIELFEVIIIFLKQLYMLYSVSGQELNYTFLGFFGLVFGNDGYLAGDKFIRGNIKKFIESFKIQLENKKKINNKITYVKKKTAQLDKIEKKVNEITGIIDQISYKGTYKLTNSKREVNKLLLELNKLFDYRNSENNIDELKKYLYKVIKNKYESAKSSYYSSGSYSSGGSYSSSSWSSSSSSSSSYSSSYSSSGSSSW